MTAVTMEKPARPAANGLREHLVQPWPSAGTIGAEARDLIGSGEGVYITDGEGRRLIDGPAGMWCTNVGHRNAHLASVMSRQALALSYNSPWYTTNTPSNDLSRRLSELAPGDLNHVFFTTGGSTAMETALRFVQFYNNVLGRPGRKRILCRVGGYHGSTYLSASLNGNMRVRDWMDAADEMVIRLSAPNLFRRPEGMTEGAFADWLLAEAEMAILDNGPDTIAAFVGEPVQASGGVIVAPDGYFRRMRDLCARYGILFIADEVVTAFGRLGHMFASRDVFGTTPDIVTFAKGVTSGYFPLGGMMVSSRLMDDLRASRHPDAMFAHGLTYSSHPIGCAVANANLDLLEGGILAHARSVSPYFQERLRSLLDLPLVGDVRGIGLMACVECVGDRKSKDPLALDDAVGRRIDRHCHDMGLLVRPIHHMCVMSPPLVITRTQIDDLVDILRKGIEKTQDELMREGVWRG